MGLFDFFKKNKVGEENSSMPLEETSAEETPAGHGLEPPDLSSDGEPIQDQPHLRRRRNSVPTAVAAPVMNPVLEQELLRNPNNVDVYLVYGQWLQARGDPRGELISIQHHLEVNPDNAEIKEANKIYMKGYQTYFLGDLEAYKAHLKLRWRLGFIYAARIIESTDPTPLEIEKIIANLASHDSSRILQILKLELRQEDNYKVFEQAVGALIKAGEWTTIRQLVFNRFPGEMAMPTKQLALDKLWPRFPNLETLGIGLSRFSLGSLDLPKLHSLELKSICAGEQTIQSLIKAKCPNLEHLVLSCDHSTDFPSPALENVLTLLCTMKFPKLGHLGLQQLIFGDEFCHELHKIAVIKNLESLDLTGCNISDLGARSLAEHKEQLHGLRRLELAGNCLTEEGIRVLEDLGPEVRTAGQR